MYILNMLIRVLLGNNNFINIPYSLCDVFSIFSGFRTYITSPPRVLPLLLDSTNVKPSRFGGAAPSAIQVSYKQSISIFSYSSISSSFK